MPTIENQTIVFRFPEIHKDAVLTVRFHRTLRIPDDNREYPLPPSLGQFPLAHVDDFSDKIPSEWRKRGGIMMPMWQSEAMWLSFESRNGYPFAVKIAAGKINAVSGETWDERLQTGHDQAPIPAENTRLGGYWTDTSGDQDKGAKDYMTVPKQRWIDGFHVDADHVRQFVAMPLGSGYSVEEQITSKAEFGGVQIIVYPMKASAADPHIRRPSALRGGMSFGDDAKIYCCSASLQSSSFSVGNAAKPDMGLAAGGLMKQQIYADPYLGDVWATDTKERCFIHLVNSEHYGAITGKQPPTKPLGPTDYAQRNYPWFDYYDDGAVLTGGAKLKTLDSVAALGVKKGEQPLPDNAPITLKKSDIHKIGPTASKSDVVRDGPW